MNLKRTLATIAAVAGLVAGIGVAAAPSASADTYWYSPASVAWCTNPHAPPFGTPYSVPVRVEHQQGPYGGVTEHRFDRAWFGIGTPGASSYNGGNAIKKWTVREQNSTRSIGGGDNTFATPNAGGSWLFNYAQTPLNIGPTFAAMVLTWRDGSTCSVRWQMVYGARRSALSTHAGLRSLVVAYQPRPVGLLLPSPR